jgi:hypothetical protein
MAIHGSLPTGEMLQEARSRPICLIVLGMHRSGTSAVTGTLGLLGAALPTDLMEATHFNAKGHFESKSVFMINEEMLQAIGSAWYDLRGISFDTITLSQTKAKLKEVVQSQYSDASLLVVKDPRFSRFFPAVRSVIDGLGALPRVVFCFRNPLDVAHSLKARDGISLQHGLGLWLRYMLDGEFHSRGQQRVFVDFADFLRNWRVSIERIERGLGIVLPGSGEAAHEVERFIESRLCHHSAGIEGLKMHSDGQAWLCPSYEAFGKLVRNPNDSEAMHQLDLIRGEFEEAAGLLGEGIREYYGELLALRTGKGELEGQLEGAKNELESVKKQLQCATRQLTEAEDQLRCTTGQLSEAKNQLTEAKKKAKKTRRQIRAIRSSRSWRATAPLRRMASLLRQL